MNYRSMPCGKQIMAIGQEGSKADIQEQLKHCYNCAAFIPCQHTLKIHEKAVTK